MNSESTNLSIILIVCLTINISILLINSNATTATLIYFSIIIDVQDVDSLGVLVLIDKSAIGRLD